MGKIVDQLGSELIIPTNPSRIVSLVPSQTELLFDLGLGDRIVGVTKFCIHPEEAKAKPIVGGTKNFKFDVIEQLRPDLIIGNKEENYEEGIALLREGYPVWMSDIASLEDALAMIKSIGEITSTQAKSGIIIQSILN
jgi:ABC-type Fe3+-hydroxamate transport system substrate-binding protein